MAAFVSFVFWLVFNVALVIPCAIFLFYTLQSVLPILAAVEDLDAPIYDSLDLQAQGATRPAKDDDGDARPLPTSASVRSMVRLLHRRRGLFSLAGGCGLLLAFNLLKAGALALCVAHPLLGLAAQVLLPLSAVQVHALWVHTVLAPDSPLPVSRRLVPARAAFGVLGAPMALYLAAEALSQRVLVAYYRGVAMKWEDFMPVSDHFHKSFVFWVVAALLAFVVVVPAYLALVRAEAGLLPAQSLEHALVPLDPALGGLADAGVTAVVGAVRSLTRRRVISLVFLYMRIFMITAVVAGFVGFVDFMWWFAIALANWRF